MTSNTIVDIVDLATKLFVSVVDEKCHIASNKHVIYIERNEDSLRMKVGDFLWWDDEYVMWTPKESKDRYDNGHLIEHGVDYDIKISKVGKTSMREPADIDKSCKNCRYIYEGTAGIEYCRANHNKILVNYEPCGKWKYYG